MRYLIGLIVLIIIYFIIYQKYLKGKRKIDKLKLTVMYIYLMLVAFVTIFPIDFALDPKWKYHSSINFVYIHIKPFNGLIHGYSGALKEIILNIIMTMPFGFLYADIKNDVNIDQIMIKTFLLSFTIESIQLIMTIFLLHYRSCDVTDLITNVIGGVIGFILYKLWKPHLNKWYEKFEK